MDLASVADELYGLPPRAFTEARDSRAADAKSSGDAELAKSVKQLRRPTTSAWLANLLVRRRPDEIDRLLALGDDMRRAQSNLEAKDMRLLADERRKLVSALAKDAQTLARELERGVNESSIQELQATLEAAVADPAACESLRSGRLTKALNYSGFGPVDLTDAVAIPPATKTSNVSAPDRSPKSKAASSGTERREASRTQAELALREARAALVSAERSAVIEQQRLSKASEQRDRLVSQIKKMEKQIKELKAKAKQAGQAVDEAMSSVERSRRATSAANDRVSRASDSLRRI